MILIALLDQEIPLSYLLLIGTIVTVLSLIAFVYRWLNIDEQLSKREPGLFYFALSFTILILIWGESSRDLIALSFWLIVLADPAATLFGRRAGCRFTTGPVNKSLWGSLVFFLINFLGLLLWVGLKGMVQLSPAYLILSIFSIVLFATSVEWISPWGTDNVFVPVLTAPVIHLLLFHFSVDILLFHGWAWLLGGTFVLLTFKKEMLSSDGALVALILAVLLFTLGGWEAAVPILFFFFSSAIMGRINRISDHREIKEAKGRKRDLLQVFSNGGVAALILALGQSSLVEMNLAYLVFLAVMAGSTADTWATEIGTMFRGGTYSILSWRKVPVGLSGGVSIPGSLAAFLGAWSIGLLAMALGWIAWKWVWIIGILGFISALIDSLMGKFLQFRWKEGRTWREDKPPSAISDYTGYRWMTNDMVNLLSGLFTGLLAFLLLI